MHTSVPERTTCRVSGEPLVPLFSLGDLHLSDFLSEEEAPGQKVELKLCLAPRSGLVQLAHSAPFDAMYQKYWYRSGTNETMTRELERIALNGQKLGRMKEGDVFIDIGANDGTLLSFVAKDKVRIGFEPAKNNYAEQARANADHIVNDYFSASAYRALPIGDKNARVVTSIAMFYFLEDPNVFVKDVFQILDDDGLWIIQMSYLPLMLQQLAFDNICHEHLSYYSLSALQFLLTKHGFEIVDTELNDTNGGSFRVYVRKAGSNSAEFADAPHRDVASYRLRSLLDYEETLNLDSREIYLDFYKKILELREKTMNFIREERAKGKKIWAYGASTKGNTLLQWFGLGNEHIDGIAERSPAKFGLKTVGSNIPIHPEEDMRKRSPDYALVLPWHFIEEFRRRERAFLENGGKFIVPCPKFMVIGA